MPRSRRGFFALSGGLLSLALGVAITVPATPAAATPTAGVSSSAGAVGAGPLHLRWELLRNEVPPQGPGRAIARLTISSDKLSLPTSGWALYFNVMDGLAPQSMGNGLALEQVIGPLDIAGKCPCITAQSRDLLFEKMVEIGHGLSPRPSWPRSGS